MFYCILYGVEFDPDLIRIFLILQEFFEKIEAMFICMSFFIWLFYIIYLRNLKGVCWNTSPVIANLGAVTGLETETPTGIFPSYFILQWFSFIPRGEGQVRQWWPVDCVGCHFLPTRQQPSLLSHDAESLLSTPTGRYHFPFNFFFNSKSWTIYVIIEINFLFETFYACTFSH